MQFALCANIKDCDRDGSGQKDRHINKQRSDPAGLRSASRGMEQDNKTSEKQICEIGNKMAGRLQLDRHRQLTPPNFRQQFLQVWMEPFVQRCCWDLKPFISTGSSAGVT